MFSFVCVCFRPDYDIPVSGQEDSLRATVLLAEEFLDLLIIILGNVPVMMMLFIIIVFCFLPRFLVLYLVVPHSILEISCLMLSDDTFETTLSYPMTKLIRKHLLSNYILGLFY